MSIFFAEAAVLKCVVADDDTFSRRTLEHHISATPGLKRVGSFVDGTQLLDFLHLRPLVDILFLDAQLPGTSAFELIRLMPIPVSVVLTSVQPGIPVNAFELQAADYVGKPVNYTRFLQAIKRAQNQRPDVHLLPINSLPVALADRDASLFLKSSNRIIRLAYDDILYVEAVSDQVVVVTTTRQLSTNQVLREVASRLPQQQFLRVHRSFVVNRRRIEAIEDADILLEGGRSVPIGRTYLSDVLAKFST